MLSLIEARIIMPHRKNTVFITCERLSGTGKLQLSFDPWIQFRAHEGSLSGLVDNQYAFTDWGRDTMISLEGLTLATGRIEEAGYILRTFAKYLKDGLIPNIFPEGKGEGLYHTADATLWFFHAAKRYVEVSGDNDTLDRLLP